jgi:hypothetical protein
MDIGITVETKIGDWLRNGWDNTYVVIGMTRSRNLWILENVDTRAITMARVIKRDTVAIAGTTDGGK